MMLRMILIMMLSTSINGHEIDEKLNDYEVIDIGSGDNSTESNQNCSNEYCIPDDEYIDMLADFLAPKGWYWLLIVMHITVFFGGIIGNLLVCIAVYRNHTMRTVTNYFIVNLAIADLMVIIFCLPSSVLWDIYETWFMGTFMCKAIIYLQTVSVSVSILTLTFISIDRWYAICFPLEFKSTTSRAKKSIIFIWIFSLLFDFPDLIVYHVVPATHFRVETIFYTQCAASWSPNNERIFASIKMMGLYFAPLLFMAVAYSKVVRVLWRSEIPGYTSSRNPLSVNELTSSMHENLENQLGSRRKAAKMLVAVVIVFGICYFPVHLLTFLRQFIGLPSNDTTRACSLIVHWLVYANSAVNPVIYNFMSGKFRREFRRSFICTPEHSYDRGTAKYTTPSIPNDTRSQNYRNTQNEINFDRIQRTPEIIPLNQLSRKFMSTQHY